MVSQEYIEAGYNVGSQFPQKVMQRAEEEVKSAYILPLVPKGTTEYNDQDFKNALLALAFLRVNQANTFATRVGGRTKRVEESEQASQNRMLSEQGKRCDFYLNILRKKYHTEKVKVTDICAIYFKTNFFYTD